jgi:class 3 adenylate cyclase
MNSTPGIKVAEETVSARAAVNALPQPGLFQAWNLAYLSREKIASRVIFVGLILGVIAISTICFVIAVGWLDKPFAGFLVNERMVLGNMGQYHWTGTQAGLKFPDKIIAADGHPISNMKDLGEAIGGRAIGETVRYAVQRGNDIIEVAIATMQFSWSDLLLTFGMPFLSGIIYFLIGVVVFFLKPDTRVSWAFLMACFFISLFAITSFDIQSTHWGFIRIYLLVNTFFPAAFIHLSLIFPDKWKFIERYPYLEVLPYIASAILIISIFSLYPSPPFMVAYQWVRLYTIACAVVLLVSFLRAYFLSASVLARQRAKVMLFGAALAFPIPALAHYVSLFGGTSLKLAIQNNFLAIPIIVFPGSIAYAIAKHNLFDVDVYVKRAVGYGIMTTLVGMTYFAAQMLADTVIFSPLFGQYADKIYPVVFALLVVFLFNPVNRKVQESVDKIFFRKRFDYKETIRSVSNALTSLLNLDQILERVVQTLRNEMYIDTVGVVVLERQKKSHRTYFVEEEAIENITSGEKTLSIAFDDPLLALLARDKKLITKYDIRENPRYSDLKESYGKSFAEMNASLALPMIYQGEVTGVLILGNKKSGHFYTREDIDLLDTMADEAAVAIENAKLAEQMKKEEGVRTNLARYLSPQIVDQIIKNDVQVNLGGDKKIVTVLFSDIRNFTGITEARPPDELVRHLNEYFTEMANIIFENQGSLEKYIGDAIVAVFGSLIDLENSAHYAVQAAIQMMKRLPQLNERWLKEYGFEMQIGIGISTGEVFLGNIGSPERMEFTVIGDTVNVASRFSGLAKPGQILITREAYDRLGSEVVCRTLPSTEVKGKSGKLEVFELLSA